MVTVGRFLPLPSQMEPFVSFLPQAPPISLIRAIDVDFRGRGGVKGDFGGGLDGFVRHYRHGKNRIVLLYSQGIRESRMLSLKE